MATVFLERHDPVPAVGFERLLTEVVVAADLASVWPVTDDRSLDPGQISATDRSAAVRLLAAESDWVADSAARLLWEASAEPGLAGEVADILTPELSEGRRLLVTALSCVLSLDPAAAAAAHFDSSDPARRRFAAMLASDLDSGRQLELLRARAGRRGRHGPDRRRGGLVRGTGSTSTDVLVVPGAR